MQKWYHILPKNTGLSIYILIIFCTLPFYFIFRTPLMGEVAFGLFLIILFFIAYRLSFISKGGLVYISFSIEMIISIVMTLYFGYPYFSLFLAFFIGNIQHKGGFITLYVVHLVTTIVAIVFGFIITFDVFTQQLPFIIIALIGVILLPFTMYNRIKQEKLQEQLADANQKLSELSVLQERQRIARDLHDTLGQKLSLIGLKSDLAGKLIGKNPESAMNELNDIRQTARTALKEVREMVSDMRGVRIIDEITHIKQILDAAQIEYQIDGEPIYSDTPLFIENVLSMCLKEAVTNIVKHSKASFCHITIEQSPEELVIVIEDNGIGIDESRKSLDGHGLQGMRERLEFVNGSLEVLSKNGTKLFIRVPNVFQQSNGRD